MGQRIDGFPYWSRIVAFSISCCKRLAAPMGYLGSRKPPRWGPHDLGTKSGQNVNFFALIFSGKVTIILWPFTAADKARPIPVLPLVGSMMVSPGFILPDFHKHTFADPVLHGTTSVEVFALTKNFASCFFANRIKPYKWCIAYGFQYVFHNLMVLLCRDSSVRVFFSSTRKPSTLCWPVSLVAVLTVVGSSTAFLGYFGCHGSHIKNLEIQKVYSAR